MPDNALRREVLVPVSTVKATALKNIFGEEITKKLKTCRFQLKKCTFFTSPKSALFLRNRKKQQRFFVFRLESTQEWQCNSCVGGQVLNPPFLDRRLIFHYFGDCLRVDLAQNRHVFGFLSFSAPEIFRQAVFLFGITGSQLTRNNALLVPAACIHDSRLTCRWVFSKLSPDTCPYFVSLWECMAWHWKVPVAVALCP